MFLEFLNNFYEKSIDRVLVGWSDINLLSNSTDAEKRKRDTDFEKFNDRFKTNGAEIVSNLLPKPKQNDIITDYLKIFIQKEDDKKDFQGLISSKD